ncbi:MAG: rhodanese-like domain-containing protein [Moraxellaceae bacterium]|nr:rhodanese-like domain-containing protein [Moraxellaceae bacterium]
MRYVLMMLAVLGLPAQAATPVSAEALLQQQAAQADLLVLDVRSAEEFAAGHVPGAINVPLPDVSAAHPQLKSWKDRQVVVYCRSGRRSELAIKTLEAAGFSRVLHLEGDMLGWEAARRSVAVARP